LSNVPDHIVSPKKHGLVFGTSTSESGGVPEAAMKPYPKTTHPALRTLFIGIAQLATISLGSAISGLADYYWVDALTAAQTAPVVVAASQPASADLTCNRANLSLPDATACASTAASSTALRDYVQRTRARDGLY
jgi:hypothetical protein